MADSPQQGFSLHPNIDVDALQREFAETKRVQIAPFIDPRGAARLRDHLIGRDDWRLAAKTSAKRPVEFDRPGWETMSPAQREAVHAMAAPADTFGFRYMFEQIVAVGADLQSREPATLLGRFARFMSSAPVLDAVRRITGAQDVSRADARATCFGPRHFLARHGDKVGGMHRRIAYVFGLTEEWRPEWGGLLLFHDEQDDVERGMLPRMNSLNLFAVPQEHSVSLVSPFAPVPRLSVTGWLRARPEASAP